MNFFEHQEQARQKTRLLVFLFVCALASIIFSLYVVARGFMYYWASKHSRGATALTSEGFLNLKLLLIVTAVTCIVVGLGAIFRMITLGSGGKGVAELLGGTRVNPSTTVAHERKLLNVVEEMSIACGVPVPQVYIMNEESTINAFAAGTNPSNSVIGVTKGAVENLDREELQGVIAHEFSHIFNGDMKLNLKLMGAISGIVVISTIGRIFLQIRTQKISSDKKGNPLPFIGLALIVIGYAGVFFGRLIKAAVSRQREFLADASAVQFTRNPEGIANALDKIGRMSYRKLVSPYAEETSHMMFETPFRNFGGMLATHPPVQERIKRIAPNFNPKSKNAHLDKPKTLRKQNVKAPSTSEQQRFDVVPGRLRNRFGTLNFDSLTLASQIIEDSPAELIEKAHTELGARAIVLAMTFLPSQKEEALTIIRAEVGPKLATAVEDVCKDIAKLNAVHKLPLLQICLPTLRLMEPERRQKYFAALERLVELEDGNVVFEFCVLRIVEKAFAKPQLRNIDRHTIRDYADEVLTVLKFASHVGADSVEMALTSFQAAIECLNRNSHKPLKKVNVEAEFSNMPEIKTMAPALKSLNKLEPFEKSSVLLSAAMAIASDGRITHDEMDLLRALSISLDTPLPASVLS